MNEGKYIFSQIVDFIPQRQFRRMVARAVQDKTRDWTLSHWNHLLLLIFGQLNGCNTMRELVSIVEAHSKKAYALGFGDAFSLTSLSRANAQRDYRVFEGFAYYMVELAQRKRVGKRFVIPGKYYAFDSTTIDLCMGLFEWATFRKTKSGIKIQTQFDISTQVPADFFITNASVHDIKALDHIQIEPLACYIFDKGYFDLARMFRIQQQNAFFVIREKGRRPYGIIEGEDILEGGNGVLRDQTIRFTRKSNFEKYPSPIRRIVYYAAELGRTFTYYTNNFSLTAAEIALLYKNRWQVESFFKWIKQHLRVKHFWGNNENAVRIQIYAAIITYCTVAIIEKDLNLERSVFDVLRILGSSLLVKDNMMELLSTAPQPISECAPFNQLSLNFG